MGKTNNHPEVRCILSSAMLGLLFFAVTLFIQKHYTNNIEAFTYLILLTNTATGFWIGILINIMIEEHKWLKAISYFIMIIILISIIVFASAFAILPSDISWYLISFAGFLTIISVVTLFIAIKKKVYSDSSK